MDHKVEGNYFTKHHTTTIVAGTDPHYFGRLDSNTDPHLSEMMDPDPDQHQKSNSSAAEAQNRALKVCRPVVANSHQVDEEQDLDLIQESEPDRIKMKSFRNRIILMRIRYPDKG
jgi:hypothetical protein